MLRFAFKCFEKKNYTLLKDNLKSIDKIELESFL